MSKDIAQYTWLSPPAPGTMVRFVDMRLVYSRSRALHVQQDALAMVIALLPTANIVRLLLDSGVVVELYCLWPEKMYLKPV